MLSVVGSWLTRVSRVQLYGRPRCVPYGDRLDGTESVKEKKWFFATEETFFHICEQDQKTKSNGNTTTKYITY